MNLMFRKNFGGDKGPGGGGLGGGGGGLGEVRPALGAASIYGTSGASFGQLGTRFATSRSGIGVGQSVIGGTRGPVRRSREYGYFPSMADHEHQGSHGYRTHLFLSPPAGGTLGSPPEDPGERLGPPPRRNSGPHVIKWGGGGFAGSAQGAQTQARRKQNQIGQQKEISDPPTPTASRQVGTIRIYRRDFFPFREATLSEVLDETLSHLRDLADLNAIRFLSLDSLSMNVYLLSKFSFRDPM